jgi:hypothetical protein
LKECKTDLEFVEAVEFLSINYSGIEFYLINEERMIRIMKLIHERKKI